MRVRPLLAVVLLLAGCGASGTGAPDAGPSYGAAPAPGTEPGSRGSFGFDVAIRQEAPDALVVRYGDSSTCPYEQVDAEVEESASEVVVTLTAVVQEARPCSADVAPRDVTLRLGAPLADRRVVDGATGEQVAVATGEPPGPPGSPVPLPTR